MDDVQRRQQLNLLAVGQPIHDLGLRDQVGGGDQPGAQDGRER
nr:hypothetical protein [Massilia alkalitolerans]